MSEVELTEGLDQAIEAMLHGKSPATMVDREIAELVTIAAEVRELPRANFKTRLRTELQREITMKTATKEMQLKQSTKAKIRKGFRTVTPYLIVPDVFVEAEFVKQAFGAEGHVYGLGSAGGYHSEYKIGNSMVMIGGGGKDSKWKGSPMPASLHLYVEDVDKTYEHSLHAGAKSLMPPTEMEYGERGASVEDPGGNHWYLATAHGPSYLPEGLPNLMPYFNPRGAPKMIEFLKQAFDAEQTAVYQTPDGIVYHAKVRIGDSIVEMGEAHGQAQPRPMQFMLYVDDCDEWYHRAMKAE